VILVTAVGSLRSRITPSGLRLVNRVSGLIIGAFGAVAIWAALT
jgi:hypothetical protein